MPDDMRSKIEDRIDRPVAGAIALRNAPGMMSTIAPQNMNELFEFAKLMAISEQCIRAAFRNKPGACLAIALQAFRTGADPFAVANKAYLVNDQIAYESQYIHAVLNTSGALKKRLRPIYSGEGKTRRCKVIGEIVGEEEPFEYESPTIEAIPIQNSPLWKNDPDQQLFYYASRAWARRWLPEVLLGMNTGDDIASQAIDVTPPPRPKREDFGEEEDRRQPDPEPKRVWTLVLSDGEVIDFDDPADFVDALGQEFDAAANAARLDALWTDHLPVIETLPAEEHQRLRTWFEGEVTACLRAAQGSPPASEAPEPQPQTAESQPAATAAPPRKGRPPGSRNKPKDPESPPPESPQVQSAIPPGGAPAGAAQNSEQPAPDSPREPQTAAPDAPAGAALEYRQSYIVPMVQVNGEANLRAWAFGRFMDEVRKSRDIAEFAMFQGDNTENIEKFKRTYTIDVPMFNRTLKTIVDRLEP
jgi:hypothetical protein